MTMERFSATKDFVIQHATGNLETLTTVAVTCGIPFLIYGYMTLVAMTVAKTKGESAADAAKTMWSSFLKVPSPGDLSEGR